ncbi:alkaline phosphatase D family protein [Sphingopyxis sp. DHUNG17]|uniref:alkaline phosphatase D family protein n=1 Tax=Sphingopyxis jiangsuensis TaxID=2871171 RepID=UPI00191E1C7A|nr:alkaline phosphatase D family protein [Sphingopyxis lutea]
MAKLVSRRQGLRLALAGMAAGAAAGKGTAAAAPSAPADPLAAGVEDDWSACPDRIWLGRRYWANPLEDWRLACGGAECLSRGGSRSVHSLPHQLENPQRPFRMSVVIRNLGDGASDGGASMRLGIQSDIGDYRANCFAAGGIDAGIVAGSLRLGAHETAAKAAANGEEIELSLSGEPAAEFVRLRLSAQSVRTGEALGTIEHLFPASDLVGNVALVSNFAISAEDERRIASSRYRFRRWRIAGQAFGAQDNQQFGPILWAMYTLHDMRSGEGHVLKMTAFIAPCAADGDDQVELQVRRGGRWVSAAQSLVEKDSRTALFRVANWDAAAALDYRILYRERRRNGDHLVDSFTGRIAAEPKGGTLRMAALTCQNDYAFPYAPVAQNLERLRPDILFFSGDQLYENHGGFGVIRSPAEPAILNYLRKFYQFGWAFRDAMRSVPTVCLPDDHDVLQGNLWGEGGRPMSEAARASGRSDASGGYIAPVRVVDAVHRTNVAHLPDAVDPAPSNGIGVYFTELVYGGVSFAILADRQWKSGPERLGIVVGETGSGEDPLFVNPAFDRADLELLGARQEAFLERWGDDWRGHRLKAVLSQTVFAGISTHQPEPDQYLKYDFDSSGWPATARDRAIRIMRKSRALHICGDTHLATLSQYGVESQRDANWAFCTPAIAAGWPRWWQPDAVGLPHAHRPKHGLANTGEYRDSFGNRIYVYAVGNPLTGMSGNRYVRAHEKGSGFGLVDFDCEKRTYRVAAYRFLANAGSPSIADIFPGWPVVIGQDENGGLNRID